MSDELRRLRAQQEATSAQLHRMQMQQAAQQARHQPEEVIEEEEPAYVPQYQQVSPNEAMMQSIAQNAANQAAWQAQQQMNANNAVQEKIKTRMQRIVADYPAIQQEDSQLTIKSRDVYARITQENPTLDEATKYELAVREAASLIGARPVNAPIEDIASQDYLMGASRQHNPALGNAKSSKNRLTTNVIKNAQALGINCDPNSAEGKKNLAELNEYSARFNADQDESSFRYK